MIKISKLLQEMKSLGEYYFTLNHNIVDITVTIMQLHCYMMGGN